MTLQAQLKGAAFAAICAVTLAACEGGMASPTSPSAAIGNGGAASNPDGSTLKVNASVASAPVDAATGIGLIPTLVGVPGTATSAQVPTSVFAYRFQVSTSDTFDPIVVSGTGALDSQGIARFTIQEALKTGTKYFWRLRAELEDQFGPWSNVRSFTTTGTAPPTPRPDVPGEKRTPNPPAGQTLPLPDMRGELAKFSNASDSCPQGIKYVLNPWLNRVVDHFRTFDTRWGYNGKPTRTAADNNGVPVQAAGDEVAYNPTSLADEGNTSPLLVDLLVQHCGPAPVVGWRVFTGEEPGRWTGAGRF